MEKTLSTSQQVIPDEVADRRKALFKKYIMPYQRMIYKLCIKYTFKPSDVEDNYVNVLTNLYKYIETYDPERSIRTWIHIVTKRHVYDQDQKHQRQRAIRNDDNDIEDYANDDVLLDTGHVSGNVMGIDNYREYYSDKILNALDKLKPQYRRAFIYQQAGYKLKEIAEIEHANGDLESRNIETIKSRLYWARQQLKELLKDER